MTTARLEGTSGNADVSVISVISIAHFVSHYFMLLLPPLFVFIRADYQVSYTELGLALTAFNVVSALLQTPAGFLVDRVGPRPVLIAGLLLGAAAFAAAGLIDSFWVFVAMFAVAGLANTVYHPADYTVLSRHISPGRMGQAYSVHAFAGMLGSAAAPASLLLLQGAIGWRGAFCAAAAMGVVAAAILALQREPWPNHEMPTAAKSGDSEPASWQLLLSGPILRNLLFFVLLAAMTGGMQNYFVVAVGALHGTPPSTANVALSGYLIFTALGVLAGGAFVSRTQRHGLVAAIGLLLAATATIAVAMTALPAALLTLTMSAGGFCGGIIIPSRDMIVREVTPAGSFGKVFGFVTTGFNIGGMVSPIIFGAMLDHDRPQWVFLFTAACMVLAIATVATRAEPKQV